MKVHILHDGGGIEIWLDPDDTLHTGLCIGTGDDFDEAKADALNGLLEAHGFLNAIASDRQFELVPR